MDWGKLILYILGGVALIVLGWLLNSAFTPKPSTSVIETIVRDTVKVERPIYIQTTSKPTIVYQDTGIQALSDSVAGNENEVDYKIKYSYWQTEGQGNWDIQLKPLIKTIREYVTKDSIQTVVQTKYIQTPFFMQTWFYISIIELVVVVLAIIF